MKAIDRRYAWVILGILLFTLAICPHAGAQGKIALKGARLIDGTGKPAVENSVLIIDGDHVAAAGKAGSVPIPKDADVKDVSGKTIMPALINLHGHLGLGGGLGLHVIKTTNTTFDVFAGGDYDREAFSPNPPLVLTNVTRNVAEVDTGEELSWKLNSRVSFDERLSAFPNMSDLGQYRLQFDATAATKLKTWLSWQITVSDRYLSNPLPGLKSNDELLSTGLRLSFGKGAF